jgi:hypothetical protein
MKIKAILMVTLVCILIFCFSSTSFASQIFVDLQEVKADVAPQIINERTMVPVRAIAEMVGCRVEWITDKQQVEIYDPTSNVLIIVMQIENKIANYSKYVPELNDRVGVECEMDSPPIIINSRTFVPLRFISEAIGYTVDYNVDNGNIYLFSPAYMNNQIGEGMGTDVGEGIGTTTPITNAEISYILSFKTQSWLDLTDNQQDNVVSLIARWWELVDGYVVPDLDALKQDLNHQMATYFRNEVNASLFETACDIRVINTNKYLNAKN